MLDSATVERLPIFRDISAQARRALASRGVLRSFAAGQTLFTAGSPARGIFVLIEGRVRVLRGAGNRQHVVHVEEAGGTLGEVPLFAGGGYPATAVAAEPTRCAVFDREALTAAIAADPGTAWVLLARLAERVRELVERMDRLATRSVGERLAGFILARSGGRQNAFSLGMSQGELAEELGTVREVVVRALRELRADGVIRSAGSGRLEVLDAAALARRAGAGRRMTPGGQESRDREHLHPARGTRP